MESFKTCALVVEKFPDTYNFPNGMPETEVYSANHLIYYLQDNWMLSVYLKSDNTNKFYAKSTECPNFLSFKEKMPPEIVQNLFDFSTLYETKSEFEPDLFDSKLRDKSEFCLDPENFPQKFEDMADLRREIWNVFSQDFSSRTRSV